MFSNPTNPKMKLSFLFASVAAAAQTFQITVVRSGTPYQGGMLGASSEKVVYGGGSEIQWVLNDDGSLADKNSEKYVAVEDGWLVLSDTAQKSFSLNADRLAYNDAPSFGICPDDQDGVQFNGTCSNYTGVALQAISKKFTLDYHPDGIQFPGKPTSTSEQGPSSVTNFDNSSTLRTTIAKRDFGNGGGVISATFSTPPRQKGTDYLLMTAKSRGWLWHWLTLKKVDSHPEVFSVSRNEGKEVRFSFEENGVMYDMDGKRLIVRENGEFGEVKEGEEPLTGFLQDGVLLLYKGDPWFYACQKAEDELYVYKTKKDGCTAINFHLF